jgi:hypothetical protein
MRYSTTSALVLGALTIGEVIASPTHGHMHRHAKKDIDWNTLDWNNMGIDWASAYKAGQHSTPVAEVATTPTEVAAAAATTVAATTTAAPAPAATTPSSPASDAGSQASSNSDNSAELFGGVVGISNSRTSFGGKSGASGATGDFYVGNVGVPYGANVIKVGSTSGYDFTNTFVNPQKKSITVNIWQKVGPDGQVLSGSALAPKKPTLTFVLAPGASQVVAFQENTQVGWAEATSSIASSGAFATTWGEANFVPTGSGYDVSAIMNPHNNNYDMTITSQEAPACTSSRTENYWLTATQPIGGSNGSCFIAQNTAHLKTVMGGTI